MSKNNPPAKFFKKWEDLPKISKLVGNKFLVLKTPLNERYNLKFETSQQFRVKDVFNYCEVRL
jgi:hypothetical protein